MKILFKIILSALLISLVVPAEGTNLKVGETAPGFTLPGVDGRFHSLDSLAGKKGTVIVFTCNHCPFAKAYQGRIKDISRDYKDKGINLIAINPNDAKEYPTDNYAHMIKRAKTESYNFPYLRDRTQKTAVNYGALVTPHIFLLDAQKRLYYNGPIDDSWKDPDKAENMYLRDAIDNMMAGKKLAKDKIRTMGCSIKWLEARGKDVTPYQVADNAESIKPLKKGDTAPDALISDMDGQAKWLSGEIKGKKTALIFFRGGWCPYCTKHLKDLRTVHNDLTELGFKIVAITPDTPDAGLSNLEDMDLGYSVLSDPAMEAIMAFGLAYRVPAKTVERYSELKIPLRSAPGIKDKTMPVPAAYLINSNGKVVFKYTNPDYKERIGANRFLDAARKVGDE